VTRKLRFMPTKATFRLRDQVGAGTVGVVFRAESPDIAEPVAVKLLHPSVSSDRQVVDRFEREVMIMERLNHPHIVRHYGGGMMDGQYFYAMQLLDHGSLKDRLLRERRLSWPQAAAYAAQIASALQHAHNHGIIHRDLKPSNLFFTADGKLVLGDFGIARDTQTADITADRITVGTYAYMSPEQICADRNISGSADLYSLGCVMYEMLTGRPPFAGANFAQVWEQHLHKPPRPIREQGIDCPDWLERLALQLLAKQPRERPFNARAVEGILRQHLREEFGETWNATVATATPTVRVAADGDHPRRWTLWVVIAAAAAIVLAAALWWN
jgi:serine/threonine protein kinase